MNTCDFLAPKPVVLTTPSLITNHGMRRAGRFAAAAPPAEGGAA